MVEDFTPEEARRRMIKRMRLDEEGEEETRESEGGESGGNGGQAHYGNTRLPYGLCQRFGIDLPADAKPRDAWAALEKGTGYTHDEIMETVERVGNTKSVQAKKRGETNGATGGESGARPKGAGLKNPKSMRGIGVKEHEHFDSIYAAEGYLSRELGIPVDYNNNGMDAEKANKFNDTILTVVDELGIKPNRVQALKKGNPRNAYMCISWNDGGQQKGPLTFKICRTEFNEWESDPEKWHDDRVSSAEKERTQMEYSRESGHEDWAKQHERDMKAFQKGANYRVWRMGGGGKDFETAVFHEMGHVLMNRVGDGGKTNVHDITHDAFLQARKKKNEEGDKDIYKISEYADTCQDEFFAECFAGYMTGVELPDYCEKMVENMIGELGKLREEGYDDFKGTWNDAQ